MHALIRSQLAIYDKYLSQMKWISLNVTQSRSMQHAEDFFKRREILILLFLYPSIKHVYVLWQHKRSLSLWWSRGHHWTTVQRRFVLNLLKLSYCLLVSYGVFKLFNQLTIEVLIKWSLFAIFETVYSSPWLLMFISCVSYYLLIFCAKGVHFMLLVCGGSGLYSSA